MLNCPEHVHQPQHNHGCSDHGLEYQINHRKVIGNIMRGVIHKTHGTDPYLAVVTSTRFLKAMCQFLLQL